MAAATMNYINPGVQSVYDQYNQYYQNKGAMDINRNSIVSNRRSSDTGPQALNDFNLQYGLGASKQMGDLSMQGATQAENEAMQFGGTSAFTGNTLQGALPFQAQQQTNAQNFTAGQSEIQREFDKAQSEAQWAAQKQISENNAANSLWGSIFGGVGSLLGPIFAGGKK